MTNHERNPNVPSSKPHGSGVAADVFLVEMVKAGLGFLIACFFRHLSFVIRH
jgi:hypothetical protein